MRSYYGAYKVKDKEVTRPSPSLQEPKFEKWKAPDEVQRTYKIGVLVPHLKDKYWLAINNSLINRARQLQINMVILSAGGYDKGGLQRRQLTNDLIKEKVDGIIIASIFYDKLDRFIRQIDKLGIPVVAMINDVYAPTIKAKSLVSFYDVGYRIGEFIIEQSGGREIQVAFMPGPKNSDWAPATFKGFKRAINDNPKALPLGRVVIVAEQYAEMASKVQSTLSEYILKTKFNIDYLIGNAVAAKEATKFVKKYKEAHPNLQIVSTYTTPEIFDLVKQQVVLASAFDNPMAQAKMAVDMLVRILNGDQPGIESIVLPFRVAPVVQVIDGKTMRSFKYEDLFGDKDFKPTFKYSVQPQE